MHPAIRWYSPSVLAWAFAVACNAVQAEGVFVVTEPWVRPGIARQPTECYVQLMSSTGATLIDASSPLASRIVLRSPAGKTIAPTALALPAAEVVQLRPKGNRLVLQGLQRDLRTGDRVPMVLTIRHADLTVQEIAVDAEVRLHSPTDDHRHPHKHS